MSTTNLDDTFNAPAQQAQAALPLTREDVLGALRWSKPQEVATKKGPRIRRTATATPEAIALFAREGPDLYALGYVIREYPPGSGRRQVTKWDLLPPKIIVERQAAVEMSRATDSTINAPRPEGLEYLGFQRAGIAYGFERRSVLIADEMGLGKTIQAIGILNCMPLAEKILVICPASLKINWRRELQKWMVKQRTVFIADAKLFPEINGVVIVNYDVLAKHEAEIKGTEWDVLIVDEAHYLKNPKARRSIQVLGLDATREEKSNGMADIPGITATKKILLTGTPIPNRPKELWPLIHYLDPITWSSWWKFAGRYCNANQDNHWSSEGASHLNELQDVLRRSIMIRRKKKDVLKDLPPKTRKIVEIAPDAQARLALREEQEATDDAEEIRLQAQVELAKASDDQQAYATAVDQLARRIKRDGEDLFTLRKNTAIAKARMPAVMELIEEAVEESEKVIIFAHHKEVVQIIATKFGRAATLIVGDTPMAARDQNASRFQNDPSCKVIIGSIESMGTGWTLTASSHVIMFELDWVPGNVSQCEDRAHRIGQTDNVLVEHYVLEGSLDADMARRIVEKQEIIDQALDTERTIEARAPAPKTGGSRATFDALATEAGKMTPEQRTTAHAVIRMLAAGTGLNKLDAQIARFLSDTPMLTPKQCALARRIALRYAATQLSPALAAKL